MLTAVMTTTSPDSFNMITSLPSEEEPSSGGNDNNNNGTSSDVRQLLVAGQQGNSASYSSLDAGLISELFAIMDTARSTTAAADAAASRTEVEGFEEPTKQEDEEGTANTTPITISSSQPQQMSANSSALLGTFTTATDDKDVTPSKKHGNGGGSSCTNSHRTKKKKKKSSKEEKKSKKDGKKSKKNKNRSSRRSSSLPATTTATTTTTAEMMTMPPQQEEQQKQQLEDFPFFDNHASHHQQERRRSSLDHVPGHTPPIRPKDFEKRRSSLDHFLPKPRPTSNIFVLDDDQQEKFSQPPSFMNSFDISNDSNNNNNSDPPPTKTAAFPSFSQNKQRSTNSLEKGDFQGFPEAGFDAFLQEHRVNEHGVQAHEFFAEQDFQQDVADDKSSQPPQTTATSTSTTTSALHATAAEEEEARPMHLHHHQQQWTATQPTPSSNKNVAQPLPPPQQTFPPPPPPPRGAFPSGGGVFPPGAAFPPPGGGLFPPGGPGGGPFLPGAPFPPPGAPFPPLHYPFPPHPHPHNNNLVGGTRRPLQPHPPPPLQPTLQPNHPFLLPNPNTAAMISQRLLAVSSSSGNGDRFHDYLKASGKMDDKLAAATAEAFHAFLQQASNYQQQQGQQGQQQEPSSPMNQNSKHHHPPDMSGREIQITDDDVSELGNSIMGNSDWDNGTFYSYPSQQQQQQQHHAAIIDRQEQIIQRQQEKLAKLQQQQQQQQQQQTSSSFGNDNSSNNEWGEMKQNQEFVQQRRDSMNRTGNNGNLAVTDNEQQQNHQKEQSSDEIPSHPIVPFSVQQERLRDPLPPRLLLGNYGAILDSDALSIDQRPDDEDSLANQSSSGGSTTSTLPTLERSFEQQWASLTKEQKKCFTSLKKKWVKRQSRGGRNGNSNRRTTQQVISDRWILQFAKCSPGKPFTVRTALKVMKNTNPHYLKMCDDGMTERMEQHVLSKMCFPTKIKTKTGLDVGYVRPSRYFPRSNPILLNELSTFVLNCRLNEKEDNCEKGVAVLLNLKDYSMKNFTVASAHSINMIIQGFVFPARISAVYMVDYPSWFGSIWSITKHMAAPSFRRMHFLKPSEMSDYFEPGFEQHLPDDMYGGLANTDEMIQNFIEERKRIDSEQQQQQQQRNRMNV